MKKYLCVGLVIFLCVSMALAQESGEDARLFLKGKIDSVLTILENQDMTDSQKRDKIESTVDPVFNYDLMAKLSLGRKYWPQLSTEQQQVFTQRFTRRLKASYFDKISMYSGDTDARIEYKQALAEAGKIHVPVEVRAKDEKIDILYKLYSADDAWRIYDVEINGVSIIQSYRSQFDQVLTHGTVADLLEELKQSESSAKTQ